MTQQQIDFPLIYLSTLLALLSTTLAHPHLLEHIQHTPHRLLKPPNINAAPRALPTILRGTPTCKRRPRAIIRLKHMQITNPNRPITPRYTNRIRTRRKGYTVRIQFRPRPWRGVAGAGVVVEAADPTVMRAGGELVVVLLLAVCDGTGSVGVGLVPELGDVFLERFLL